MPYDDLIADRIRQAFHDTNTSFKEKKMFGGLCFMVDDKMCCGLLWNKKKETDLLMARIGEAVYEEAMKRVGCHPMDFTGRPMRGYVFITPDAFDLDEDLAYWIQLCVNFNPFAKASVKKKA